MPQTGPTTLRGKAKVGRNAWKHGILSVGIVLHEAEDARDWQEHFDGMCESHKPEGHLEHMLVERAAIYLWKMRRVDMYHVNGVIAVPIMVVMMWLGTKRELLGDYTLTRRHRVLGWFATVVMGAAVVAMFVVR